LKNLLKFFSLTLLVFMFVSCKKDDPANVDKTATPNLITTGISNIAYITGVSGGNLTVDNGTTVSARGVCWNTTGSPTISDAKTDQGAQSGAFESTLTSLKINTKYFVRAYAVTSQGTFYGNEQSFMTLNPKLFIRGKLGNESLECYYYYYNPAEGVNNYFNYIDHNSENRFYLKMYSNIDITMSNEIQIDINRVNIDTLITPWENELPVSYNKTYVNLYRVNIRRASNLWGIYDSINYLGAGLFQDQVFVKVTEINGDTIEGSFHGTLRTMTGLKKEMTDGEFKVKFNRVSKPW
jgi:hypothetical protein